MGFFSSISFNDKAIVRNFCPKKLYSLKLFKDLTPTRRELSPLIIEPCSTCSQECHPDNSITDPKNLMLLIFFTPSKPQT